MKDIFQFKERVAGVSEIRRELKNVFYKRLTRDSLKLFMRGRDIISVNPHTNAVHEPSVTHFISHCASSGYSDFLIDIGANIGLTTSQNGSAFQRIYCFEPNPLCAHILTVNVAVSGLSDRTTILNYGLGDSDGQFDLCVPHHNWGGAFVRASANSYSDDILAKKDGFDRFDAANYSTQSITIRTAHTALSSIFAELNSRELRHGVIKIDVEGMERVVLSGLGRALPEDMRVVVLMENWGDSLDFAEVRAFFGGRSVEIKKLAHRHPFRKTWPRVLKAAALLFSSSEICFRSTESADDRSGDIVLRIG